MPDRAIRRRPRARVRAAGPRRKVVPRRTAADAAEVSESSFRHWVLRILRTLRNLGVLGLVLAILGLLFAFQPGQFHTLAAEHIAGDIDTPGEVDGFVSDLVDGPETWWAIKKMVGTKVRMDEVVFHGAAIGGEFEIEPRDPKKALGKYCYLDIRPTE